MILDKAKEFTNRNTNFWGVVYITTSVTCAACAGGLLAPLFGSVLFEASWCFTGALLAASYLVCIVIFKDYKREDDRFNKQISAMEVYLEAYKRVNECSDRIIQALIAYNSSLEEFNSQCDLECRKRGISKDVIFEKLNDKEYPDLKRQELEEKVQVAKEQLDEVLNNEDETPEQLLFNATQMNELSQQRDVAYSNLLTYSFFRIAEAREYLLTQHAVSISSSGLPTKSSRIF